MLHVGKKLYFQQEDNDKMVAVAKGLSDLGKRMLDIGATGKCPISEMLSIEIGLIEQRLALISIYRDVDPVQIPI